MSGFLDAINLWATARVRDAASEQSVNYSEAQLARLVDFEERVLASKLIELLVRAEEPPQ